MSSFARLCAWCVLGACLVCARAGGRPQASTNQTTNSAHTHTLSTHTHTHTKNAHTSHPRVHGRLDEDGLSLLHYACLCRHLTLANQLLRSRADPDLRSGDGQTPLLMAASNGATGVVRTLLAHRADASLTDANDGVSPLQVAAVHGYAEIAAAIRKSGNYGPEVPDDVYLAGSGGGSGGGLRGLRGSEDVVAEAALIGGGNDGGGGDDDDDGDGGLSEDEPHVADGDGDLFSGAGLEVRGLALRTTTGNDGGASAAAAAAAAAAATTDLDDDDDDDDDDDEEEADQQRLLESAFSTMTLRDKCALSLADPAKERLLFGQHARTATTKTTTTKTNEDGSVVQVVVDAAMPSSVDSAMGSMSPADRADVYADVELIQKNIRRCGAA